MFSLRWQLKRRSAQLHCTLDTNWLRIGAHSQTIYAQLTRRETLNQPSDDTKSRVHTRATPSGEYKNSTKHYCQTAVTVFIMPWSHCHFAPGATYSGVTCSRVNGSVTGVYSRWVGANYSGVICSGVNTGHTAIYSGTSYSGVSCAWHKVAVWPTY